MAKTKDLFLNIAANPTMTLEDLVSVGLTSENTMLLDRAQYASNEKVQDMFRDEQGNFNEAEFNTFYDIAEQSYNLIANDEVNINLLDATAYDSDNIFVDPSKRRQTNVPFAIKLPNPDRVNTGVTRIGKTSQRTRSQDEIAQTQQVLLNPVAVENGADPIWGDAPNDSWFNDFWETRVMAAWDEDGTHIDPVTGKEVQHKAGDLKLNENGTYYYENLDGRSVYGKRILNKFNTLTTDGSSWNKYDFFDSDDIEQKSIGGSVAKNLALVGSMFIPYVGWGIAAASVAHQSAGLFATLGKMLAGSDSETLNNLEGWVKSTDRRNLKTEYAQQNMWCWENFIDLVGDTAAQLREQRAIFKFVPGIIKGDFKAIRESAMKEYTEKLAREGVENATNLSFKELAVLARKQNPTHWKSQLNNLLKGTGDIYSAKAQKAARDYIQSYYKLGEPIAKAYMTAITVQDTFGEAIEAGASDSEATLLTLGYAAAEAALLSTDLGKWIMPELRTERQRYKMIAKKLLELPPETREMSKQIARLSGETKKEWAKRLFNIGKDIMTAEYSTAAKTVGSVLAQGLGEGIEEVSEEALADFSKSCFNLVQQLQGDDVRMNAWNHNWSWSEAANRYGMSFAGGILGGGINAAASDYKVNRDLLNMDSQQAMQQLVYMTRNNEMDDFWKVINKTTLASKELSTKLNESGTGYKPGTKDDNQDLEAKRALKKQISMIESIINAENAKLNDSGLLSTLIKADPSLQDLDPVKEYRMRALSNSATAGRFLNEWNTILSDITKNRMDQAKIIEKYGDASIEKYSEEDKQLIKYKQQDLKVLQERKEAMLDGQRTREYVRDALFEMTHAINEMWDDLGTEIRFIESKTGKKYADVSEAEKAKLKEQYEKIKNSNQKAERVHELAEIYETLATSASDGITRGLDFYEKIKNETLKNIADLQRITSGSLQKLIQMMQTSEDGIASLQDIINNGYLAELVEFGESAALMAKLREIEDNTNAYLEQRIAEQTALGLPLEDREIQAIHKKDVENSKIAVMEHVLDRIAKTQQEIIKTGFIHPETKRMLGTMIGSMDQYFSLIPENDPDFYDLADEANEKIMAIQKQQEQIDKLSNTPILENLKNFQLSTAAEDTVLDLITKLIQQENGTIKDISQLQLDDVTTQQFKDARTLLTMYRAAIVGARYDNVDIDTIIGFNTTLNELSGKNESPQLAEIDAQTADLILEDINKLLHRLDYIEQIHTLNTGNKYNVQNKVATNKQFILYNRINQFISTVQNDDEWKEGLEELKQVVNSSKVLKEKSGIKLEERTFSLNPQEKIDLERDSIAIQSALHTYLNKHIDGSDASVAKLVKLLTYDNFKGLIRQNNESLNQSSQDIDDNAFIWWLCATAALDPSKFYNNYRHIIGQETEGQKPVAPIATQELGVFTLTAAITNGDMFRTFGKALRQSLGDMWKNASPETRNQIEQDYGDRLLDEEQSKLIFKSNDFLPNFDNIIFVEGIAGSGKTKGVLTMLGKLLQKTNPDLVGNKVIFAHTSKTKATSLGESTEFKNFDAHDHDSLLQWMSADYTNKQGVNGLTEYVLDKDVSIQDHTLRSNWQLKQYDPNDVPKLIIIDEWSHYNQMEQDLIQRFSQKYGITVMAMGDYDQLTPQASIKKSETDQNPWLWVTPNRNMTPRTIKLGVSMRTDNEIKNRNMSAMLAWKLNPTHSSSIELHYYEDESGIYGDKAYSVGKTYGTELENIKMDVKKMISTLKDPSEKIGYIYTDPNSELYKWLTTTEGVKEHVQPYSEKDAHGMEAQYYIIENNRQLDQDALQYFNSTYTGITRSEQGSIVITNPEIIHQGDNKYNKRGILIKSIKDDKMLPNTFTDAGTREYSRKRKDILDAIFGDQEVTPFDIKDVQTSEVNIDYGSDDVSLDDSDSTDDDSSDDSGDATLDTEPDDEPEPESEVTPQPNPNSQQPWQGPLPQGQILYDRAGIAKYEIVGENMQDPSKPKYVVRDLMTDSMVELDKTLVNSDYAISEPKNKKLFNIGDKVKFAGQVMTVEDVSFVGVNGADPDWVYNLGKTIIPQELMQTYLQNGRISKYVEVSDTTEVTPPDTALETEGLAEYEEAINEEFETQEKPLEAVLPNGEDIQFNLFGFTFNNQYLADLFDQNDNIVVDQSDVDRIDNGYGLVKLQPQLFRSRAGIKEAIGSIRKHLQFSSNQQIIAHLKQIVQDPKIARNIGTIRWAFVSKSKSNANTRLKYPQTKLEYMGKDDSYVPKTLSAIVYDTKGNPILELPIITLQSPHSIFRELKKKGIAQDITRIWNFGEKQSGETEYLLKNILKVIDRDHANHKGYQDLGALIKLWLFSSNGVKVLPTDWNLHDSNINLGNIYIVSRYSDSIQEHDFNGEWVSIDSDTILRPDRFVSSIMMNNDKMNPVNKATGKLIPIFRPFVPYVFISDDPSITSDQQAAKRYLQQQTDPTLEKTVKVVPVSPPEVSVSEYIKAMHRILSGESTYEQFGNKFTAYRIWSVILKSDKANQIMSVLKGEHRQLVKDYVARLDDIRDKNPIKPDESLLAYKKRLGNLQMAVMKEFEGGIQVHAFLKGALVQCYSYMTPVASDSGIVLNEENLKLIQEVCDSYIGPHKVTGVMCKPKFMKTKESPAIGGFAYKVKVQNDRDAKLKYHYPGYGSFRMFAKHDTPTYNLSSLLPHITQWAKEAHQGITYKDPKTGETKTLENVWRFDNDDAVAYYLPKPEGSKLNLENVTKNYRELLAKLGIDEQYIDTSELYSCSSEAEALRKVTEQINKLYLENNGAFIIRDAKGNFKYGNVISERTPEFKNYKFDSLTTTQSGYTLRFINLDTNSVEEIDMTLDLNTDSFVITPLKPANQNTVGSQFNVSEHYPAIEKAITGNPIVYGRYKQLIDRMLACFDPVNNTVDINALNSVIAEGNFSPLTLPAIRQALMLDVIENGTSMDELVENESCVNPIKIKFK